MYTESELYKEDIYYNIFHHLKSGGVIYEAINDGENFIIKDINVQAEELINLKRLDAMGKNIDEVFPNIKKSILPEMLRKVYHTGEAVTLTRNYYEDERFSIWKSNYIFKLSSSLVVSIFENINEIIKLKDNLKRYCALFENSREIILFINEEGRILEANKAAINAYGYSQEEICFKYIEQLRAEETMHLVKNQMEKAKYYGLNFETLHKRRDGSTFPVDVSSIGIDISGEKIYCSIIRDISEKKNAEVNLIAEEERYKTLFNNAHDLVYTRSIYGRMTSCNKACERAFGYRQSQLLKMTIYQLVHPDYHEIINMPVYANKYGNNINNFEVKFITSSNKELILELSQSVLYKSGYPYEVQVIARDITKRKEEEAAIAYAGFHDKLTGLYNRTYFDNEVMNSDEFDRLPLSIIMLDVNGLKLVNDAFGHFEGDKLLKSVGKILLECCKDNYIAARIGGDEFVIAAPNTTEEETLNIIEKIKEKCIKCDAKPVNPNISIGYAIMNDDKENIEDILGEAENRMYTNKMIESKSFRSSIINSLQKTLLESTPEASDHCARIKELSISFANFIGLSSIYMDKLILLSMLYDIGKIAIPNHILDKPGKLTEDEWEIVKRHSQIGYNIASSSQELGIIAEAILYHHERWDGKGYPRGLKGEDIPLLSRIISIIDSYDVMLNERPYKKAMSREEAIIELKNNIGTQFDPFLVNKFIEMITNI